MILNASQYKNYFINLKLCKCNGQRNVSLTELSLPAFRGRQIISAPYPMAWFNSQKYVGVGAA